MLQLMAHNDPLAAVTLGSLGHGVAPVAGGSTRRASFLALLAVLALVVSALAANVLVPHAADLCQTAPGMARFDLEVVRAPLLVATPHRYMGRSSKQPMSPSRRIAATNTQGEDWKLGIGRQVLARLESAPSFPSLQSACAIAATVAMPNQ